VVAVATIRLEVHDDVVVAHVTTADDVTDFGHEENRTMTSDAVPDVVSEFIARFIARHLL
jgi:hypothetical protein